MIRRILLRPIAVMAVLASACSTGQVVPGHTAPVAAQLASAGSIQRTSVPGQGWLYVSNTVPGGAVSVYKQKGQNQQPFEQIFIPGQGPSPGDLFVDHSLNLYVAANSGAFVYVYPPGDLSPTKTLTAFSNSTVEAMAVGGSGTVYAAVRVDANPPYGYFVKYPAGQTSPTTIYTFPAPEVPLGLAIDSARNVYISWTNFQSGDLFTQVFKFAGNSSRFTNLGILNSGGSAPSGLAIDQNNNLLLVDNSGDVDVYPPGSTMPSQVISGVNALGGISLNRNNTKLWAAGGLLGNVVGVTYPGGTIFDTITGQATEGVAASPEGAR